MPAEDIDMLDGWSSLNHGGLLIAPPRIPEFFSGALDRMPMYRVERLRRDVTRVQADADKGLSAFLDTVFEDLLALPPTQWQKAAAVDKRFSHPAVTGEIVRPQRVWQGSRDEVLPLFVDKNDEGRIGVGRGRRQVSRVLEWLRALNLKVAVLTNGRQIRLIHAGADYDAFCEWDVDLWFEEGAPGAQVEALRRLLSVEAVSAKKPGDASPLLQAILASRRGQGELSAILGERVRQAVELLIQSSSTPIEETLSSGITKVKPADVYIAATRTVMRLVVVLFAEARGLLPRENPSYHQSYGLQGLREELERSAGGRAERLRHRYSAWPRLLSLFRLIYEGSAHEDLPIQQYGGGLFVPGDNDSQDPVLRALAALESPSSKQPITDDVVYRMIQLLTRSKMKVRQGRAAVSVESPVDFSDLSSEYIGILYEGLLDFELRQVPKGDAIVFVNIGDQPALPLSRLKDMNNDELKKLFEKLKAKPSAGDGEEEEVAEDDEGEGDGDGDEAVIEDVVETVDAAAGDDTRQAFMAYALDWAERAVKAAEIVKPPKGRQQTDPVARTRYQEDVLRAARALIVRLVTPGEWFLVRWGGTRKGAGTFYTRPQLAGPTTRRTLQPLAYAAVREQKDEKTGLVDVLEWAPKKPEEILALKVCDPAMGSGSFLVSALRTLTEALFESLHKHGRITTKGDGSVVRLADGASSKDVTDELLPVRPEHPEFEPRLRARLKRHVVERCLYGVDIDAVAVELARMALWIETMDPALPFEFLDHKLKVGNSLVGCWFDRFQDYPLAAWEREAGDEKHKGVHHEAKAWAEALKSFKTDFVKPQLADQLRARRGMVPLFGKEKKGAGTLHDDARKALDDMHAVPVHDAVERARMYATRVRDDASLRDLRRTFDAWCAIWFWPVNEVKDAPTPETLHDLPPSSSAIATEVAQREKFFHWEIEYPDVFVAPGSGFDGVIGNPPWEIQKPNSKEFFSNHDPLYRTYGKQHALKVQRELFEGTAAIETAWLLYQARFKALSNWVGSSSTCWGDPAESIDGKGIILAGAVESAALHETWRAARRGRPGYSDPAHPFRHQGSSDLNTYKMFIEEAHALLKPSGRLGLIVPSSVYSDKGSMELRQLVLHRCSLHWLFGFENRKKIFDIHGSFKFAVLIAEKSGKTAIFRASFMRRDVDDWDAPHPPAFPYPVERIKQLSPSVNAIVEVASVEELRLLGSLIDSGTPMGSARPESWRVRYRREFHFTDDSALLIPSAASDADASLYGTRGAPADELLPVYEGRMIEPFDFFSSNWISGKGRTALWRDNGWSPRTFRPQFMMRADRYRSSAKRFGFPKMGLMEVTSATNTRTCKGALVPDWPGIHKVPFASAGDDDFDMSLALCAAFNSFCFDFAARRSVSGLSLAWFVLENLPLPLPSAALVDILSAATLRLNAAHESMSQYWLRSRAGNRLKATGVSWRSVWAATESERLRLRVIIDAVVAQAFGLTVDDLAVILRDCDHPIDNLRRDSRELDPKGFWRVDKSKPPELRHTVLSLVAAHDLERVGLDQFMKLNDGEGWALPVTLCLSDYNLGRDARAAQHQPVAAVFGPRLHDWQLEQSAADSWQECAHHAALLGVVQTAKSESLSIGKDRAETAGRTPRAGETSLLGEAVELDLFGKPITTTGKKRGR